MDIQVYMLAFMNGEIRDVTIPDDSKTVLEDVFRLGQNDFQPSNTHCSVSVGDVIDLGEDADVRYHLVCPAGFKDMTLELFSHYKSLSKDGRRMAAWGWNEL
jgi:hypothetical protein